MTTTPHDNGSASAVSQEPTRDRPEAEVTERARGPRGYSARYKAEILAEYETLDREAQGALLRREGLYSSLISEWRKQRDRGARAALAQPFGRPPADPLEREHSVLRRRVGQLEGELYRACKVIEVQRTLSVLLAQLATDSTATARGETK